jgi:hypothetical protein
MINEQMFSNSYCDKLDTVLSKETQIKLSWICPRKRERGLGDEIPWKW